LGVIIASNDPEKANAELQVRIVRSFADDYERHQAWNGEAREAVARYLKAPLGLMPGRCLFLGCATGVNDVLPFARRASRGTRILAGDIDDSCLRRLRGHVRREQLSSVQVRRLDVTKDLSSLGTFDLVTLFFVIHRLTSWKSVIHRLANVVDAGGSLYTSEFMGPGGVIYLANEAGGNARNPVARVIRRYFELHPKRFEPELKSNSIGPVLGELGRLLQPAGHRDAVWRQTLTVGDMVERIEKKAYAPFWESDRARPVLDQLRNEFDGERSRKVTLVERIRIYRFVRP
jgi:2-polyprenyl-3-methyl-5-hydroxy-6-metoxy-1,4-benzoquinol methylase